MVKAAPVVAMPTTTPPPPAPPRRAADTPPPTPPSSFPSLSLLHSLSLHPPTSPPSPPLHPAVVASVALLLIFAFGAGVHRIDVRTGTDELWVPQRTPIMSHRDAVGDLYGAQPEWHAMILSADDGNVLTPAGVDAVWDLQEKMALIPGWNATCLRLGPPSDEPLEPLDADGCVLRGVTELWCNRTHYDAEVTSTSDPPAALMTIINTRRRTCAGGYVERLRLSALRRTRAARVSDPPPPATR